MKRIRYSGFTLIELMIALLVLGALLAIAAPAFTNLIRDNRMLSDVYAMRAALNNARSEALAQRTSVTFCRSDDGVDCGATNWNEGYIAFTDDNRNGVIDDPNDPNGDSVFVSKVVDAPTVDTVYSNGNLVRFDARGYARGFQGTFTLCDERGAMAARGLIVTPGGIVRAAVEDPNDPGIVRDLGGAEVVCP